MVPETPDEASASPGCVRPVGAKPAGTLRREVVERDRVEDLVQLGDVIERRILAGRRDDHGWLVPLDDIDRRPLTLDHHHPATEVRAGVWPQPIEGDVVATS